MAKLKKGYIQIYTGNGKGKTTAALGQAIRAAGSKLKTFIVQFMKNHPYSEVMSLRELSQWITMEQYGGDAFVYRKQPPGQKDVRIAHEALKRAKMAMLSGEFDIVILDEVCVAIYFGLLKTQEVLDLVVAKPETVELILTGRYCPEELVEKADL
ncbi:MAG: cob(I)yrinic acid a,c-diamide adenosyltransferase, partial [bacterium]